MLARLLRTLLLAALPLPLAAQPAIDRVRVAQEIDSVVARAMRTKQAAGMTVAVVRGRDTLALKAHGSADLELEVPTPDRAVYEIGSVTKQFTAAAVLQLVEQGKLALDDDITKHFPTYPVQGHKVTVRRLLDHTSGIRGYTELPEFGAIMTRSMLRDSLVALFAPRPFAFAPGEALSYNNSAYFLLGLLVEKVSGMSYAAYVRENLFARAGMSDSRYCSHAAVIPRRAHGYDVGAAGLQRAAYIDHTWPYAAGSLCSTAGDLVAWSRALHGGKILGAASYRELIAPSTLNDGTKLRYAKGLFVGDSVHGHRTIHHGGDIPGFSTELAYFPDDSLTIAVLMNTLGPVRPETLMRQIARAVLGDRTPKPPTFAGRADDYAGEYRGVGRGRELVLTFVADSARGLAVRSGGPAQPLTFLGGDTFGLGSQRYAFVREGGRVTKVRADLLSVYTIAVRR